MKQKVCVYAICKNEEQFVDRWMDSMKEADLVIVTDTGSTDQTVEKLIARGAVVYKEEIKPWRFDVARNISLDHVPEDTDICVCTDLDEIFSPGWRECVENAWQPDTGIGGYLYNWSHKKDGSPDIQFNYYKTHARKSYRWTCPIHECLKYCGNGPEKSIFLNGIVLDHYPDPGKSRGSYLPLLELAVKESPLDDRMTYYLGREYMYKGKWNECIDTCKKHLELPTATWKEERCASMRWIAKSYHMLNRKSEAYSWYYRSIAEIPFIREPYVECATMAYQRADWPLTFYMTEAALRIQQKSATYVNMGYAWDSTPDDYCAIACYWLGMYERAEAHAKAALSFSPDDQRLINNLQLIQAKL